jgi:hypothetical protein
MFRHTQSLSSVSLRSSSPAYGTLSSHLHRTQRRCLLNTDRDHHHRYSGPPARTIHFHNTNMCNDFIYHYPQCGHTEYVYGLFCRHLYEELNRINKPRCFQNPIYYFRAPVKCKTQEYTVLEQRCKDCEYTQQVLRNGRGHDRYQWYPRQQNYSGMG